MPDTKQTAALMADPELQDAQRRVLFRNAKEGIAYVDLDGQYLDANPAYLLMTEYNLTELRKRTFGDITHPEDIDADQAELDRLKAGEIDGYEMVKRYLTKAGKVVWVELRVRRVEKGSVLIHYMGFIQPIALGDQFTKVERTPDGAVLRPFIPLGTLVRDNWKAVSAAGLMVLGTLGTLTNNYFAMRAQLDQQRAVIDGNKAHVTEVERDVKQIKKKAAALLPADPPEDRE